MRKKSRGAVKRRYPVSLRPKRRRDRGKKILLVAVFVLMGISAYGVWSHLKAEEDVFKKSISSVIPLPKEIDVVGIPDSLKPPVLDFLKSLNSWAWRDQGPALVRMFPFFASAQISRVFFKRRISYQVALRRAVGLVQRRGQLLGYLDDQGVVFKAPEGLYPAALPEVQIGTFDQENLRPVAMLMNEVGASAGLPAPLVKLRYVSDDAGWSATLQDGTSVSWGDLRWTAEKIRRLGLVLADAKAHSKGDFSVDLRFFGDGKIFLKPEHSAAGNRRF